MKEKNPTRQGTNKDFIDNQWSPGQSGNPTGRLPNRKYISEGLRDYLETHPDDLALIIEAVIASAKKGDIPALKEIADRADGKVTDTHKFEGDAVVNIIYKKK